MRRFIFFAAIAAIGLVACDKSDMLNNSPVMQKAGQKDDGVIRIIKQLENPYTVKNMQIAYESLKKEGKISSNIEIKTTHYYVRFTPMDSIEYETVLADTTLALFPYPLDCELTEGETYIDEDCPTEFGRIYTRIISDYKAPIGNYEIIDELYMPNEEDIVYKKLGIAPKDWFYLLQRSELITKNLEIEMKYEDFEKDGEEGGGGDDSNNMFDEIFSREFGNDKPMASIRVYDDATGTFIPVEGAKVRARNFMHWDSKRTNSGGICQMNDKFNKVWWSIEWDGGGWAKIRNGAWLQAYYNGPNGSKNNWNLKIDGGKSKAYAHVHRACVVMFEKNPRGAGFSSNQIVALAINKELPLKISVYNRAHVSGLAGVNTGYDWVYGLVSQIYIYMKYKNGSTAKSQYIFGTTIHELAHTSHIYEFPAGLIQYIFVDKFIYESYATCIEKEVVDWWYNDVHYVMWNKKHPDDPKSYYYSDKQYWRIKKSDNSIASGYDKAYSPIFIDLIDTDNQHLLYSSSYTDYEFPDDNVSGFTIPQIRSIINQVYNISDLKTKIKGLTSDQTVKDNIDILFETYEKIN